MSRCQRRNTRQRQVILQELRANRSHPTAGELYKQVRQHMPHISLGTVYRNLDILQEAGQVMRLTGLAGQEARYDGCATPHLHFQCRTCAAIYDLEAGWPSLDEMVGKCLEEHTIAGYQVLLYGICRYCA